MNAREGMRRLGVFLGILGMLAGTVVGWPEFELYRNQRQQYKKFESLMSRDAMKDTLRQISALSEFGRQIKRKYPGSYDDLSDARVGWRTADKYPDLYDSFKDGKISPRATSKPDWFVINAPNQPVIVVQVKEDGIKEVVLDEDTYGIQEIQLTSGEKIDRKSEPSEGMLATAFGLPLIGFLLPWGGLRALTWVATGFFHRQ